MVFKFFVVLLVVFSLTFASGCVNDKNVNEEPSFELSDFKASETEVTSGEQVNVSVDVENTGDSAGEKTLELVVDDVIVDQETISLDQGESKTVSFQIKLNEVGEKEVEVQNNSITIKIKEETEETKDLKKIEHMFIENFDVNDVSDLNEVDSVYSLNQEIYTYFNISGFKVSDSNMVNWKAYVTVYGPNNQTIQGLDNLLLNDGETEINTNKSWEEVWFTTNLWPSEKGWEPGVHRIEYRIIDEVGEKEKVFTETFEAKPKGLYFEDKIIPQDEEIEIRVNGTVEESVNPNLRIQEISYQAQQNTLKTTLVIDGGIPNAQNIENDEDYLYLLCIDTSGDQKSDYDVGYYVFGDLNRSELLVSEVGSGYLDNPNTSYQVDSNTLEMSIDLAEINNPDEVTLRILTFYESNNGTAIMEIPWKKYN